MCTKDVTVACGAKTGFRSGLGGESGMNARANAIIYDFGRVTTPYGEQPWWKTSSGIACSTFDISSDSDCSMLSSHCDPGRFATPVKLKSYHYHTRKIRDTRRVLCMVWCRQQVFNMAIV